MPDNILDIELHPQSNNLELNSLLDPIDRSPGVGGSDFSLLSAALEEGRSIPGGASDTFGEVSSVVTPKPEAPTGLSQIKSNVSLVDQFRNTMKTKMSEARKSVGDMTVGQTLGLQAASAGLQAAGAISNINQETKDRLDIMREDFNRVFGFQEFQAERAEVVQEARVARDLMDQIRALDKQEQEVAAQTLSNQQQIFLRNPNTGGRI